MVKVGNNIHHADPQPRAPHDTNTIIKLATGTTLVGLITDNDDTTYREEVSVVPRQQPLPQCQQDKGADRGLQETEGRARPHSH